MSTTHGVEEPSLCSHGHACQADAWGRYIGLCVGYGHIWKIQTNKRSAKIFWEAHNLVDWSVARSVARSVEGRSRGILFLLSRDARETAWQIHHIADCHRTFIDAFAGLWDAWKTDLEGRRQFFGGVRATKLPTVDPTPTDKLVPKYYSRGAVDIGIVAERGPVEKLSCGAVVLYEY